MKNKSKKQTENIDKSDEKLLLSDVSNSYEKAYDCKFFFKNIDKNGILKILHECRCPYINDTKCIGKKCRYYTK